MKTSFPSSPPPPHCVDINMVGAKVTVITTAQRHRSRSRSCWTSWKSSPQGHPSTANRCTRHRSQQGPKQSEGLALRPQRLYQAPLSIGFSRPEDWSALPLPFPSLGDLPNTGIEPRSPALQADSLPSERPGEPKQSGGKVIVFSSSLEYTCFLHPVWHMALSGCTPKGNVWLPRRELI